MSQIFVEVTKLLKIRKLTTTPYHPQTNGALKRSHRTLAEYLRQFVGKDTQEWDVWVPYAFFAYNTSVHASTKYSPYQLLYGFPANLPKTIRTSPAVSYNYDSYANELRERLRSCYKIARENLLSSKEDSKRNYDKNSKSMVYQVNDLVLVRNETRTGKFSPIWNGLYEIISVDSPENSTIKIGNKTKTIHNNRLRVFRSP